MLLTACSVFRRMLLTSWCGKWFSVRDTVISG